MRRIRIAALAVAGLSLLAPAGALTQASAAVRTDGPPSASNCGQVQLAPVLNGDVGDDGRPITPQPDRRGVYVPIIMVPDWAGLATHDDSRTGDFSAPIDMSSSGTTPTASKASLIGELQQIPGAAVYTFDYRKSAGKWVDDPGIGPALGDAIDCLTTDLGQKAILVTHGLGGVAARYAVAGNVVGHDRGAKVSNIIGYGSPLLGSQIADLLNTGVGTTASEPRSVLRLLIGACAGLPATPGLDPRSPCGFLPAEATALGLGGGDAFQSNSPQQSGLQPYPAGVTLDSFAGDIQVKAPTLGWFNARPFRTEAIPVGDLVASAASVTAAAHSQLRANCSFALTAYGSGSQSVGLALTNDTAAAAGPWASTAQPCYSADLVRVSEFADSASAIITKEIRNRQPLLSSEVQSLPVPSLCGHPAGNLVNGRLPNVDPSQGYVALAATLDSSRTGDYIAYGDITHDDVPDTVVVLQCADSSNVPQEIVAAYDSQGTALGVISLDAITHNPRNDIYSVKVAKEQGEIRWRTTRPTDAACCPTVDAYASFSWDQTAGLKAGSLQSYNETIPAGQLLDFARTANLGKKAQALASLDILNAMVAANRDTAAFESLTCYGPSPADTGWPKAALAQYGASWPPNDGAQHGDRFCLIKLSAQSATAATAHPAAPGSTTSEPERYALLGMQHLGYRSWQAVEFRMPGSTGGPVNPQPGGGGPLGGNGNGNGDGGGGGLFGGNGPLGAVGPRQERAD